MLDGASSMHGCAFGELLAEELEAWTYRRELRALGDDAAAVRTAAARVLLVDEDGLDRLLDPNG